MKKLGLDLILLGDPTAGKDTQAVILTKKYNLKPVESGKHWRAEAKKNTAAGRWLRKTMSLGHPTPVMLMKKFLADSIKAATKNKDLLFVGNPRLKPEAQLLKKLLEKKGRNFFVIYIKLPAAKIIERSKKRNRAGSLDDTSLGIKNRLRYFKLQVSKTVKYFQKMRRLKFVNGNQSVKNVAADIDRVLKKQNAYSRSQGN